MGIKQYLLPMVPVISSIGVSLVGVYLFLIFDLPLPWLLGAILPLLFVSRLHRIQLAPARPLIHPARGLLGIAIGASFTPAIVDSLDLYLISLLFMLPFLVLVILFGKFYYQRIIGFDKDTSVFCALPGGLLEMTLICEAYGANMKQVVMTHTTRVLLIIYIIPFLIQFFTAYDLSGNFTFADQPATINWIDSLIIVATAFIGWWLAQRLGLSGASIVGPMTTCAILYMSGWVSYKLPGELINLAQLILGIRIGLSLEAISFRDIFKNFSYAVGFFLFLLVISLVFAFGIHVITDLPLIATFLAFVPGGQAEMNVVAIIIGIHLPYIALHHVTRMFLVIAFAPAIKRVLS